MMREISSIMNIKQDVLQSRLDANDENSTPLNDSLTDLSWLLKSLDSTNRTPSIFLHSKNTSELDNPGCDFKKVKIKTEPRSVFNATWQTDTSVKPPYSYATLAYLAIKSSTKKKLAISDIYAHIIKLFAYYRVVDSSWKNCVKRSLLQNKCFKKIFRKNGDPTKVQWAIDFTQEQPSDYQQSSTIITKPILMKKVTPKNFFRSDTKLKRNRKTKKIAQGFEQGDTSFSTTKKEPRYWNSSFPFGNSSPNEHPKDYEVPQNFSKSQPGKIDQPCGPCDREPLLFGSWTENSFRNRLSTSGSGRQFLEIFQDCSSSVELDSVFDSNSCNMIPLPLERSFFNRTPATDPFSDSTFCSNTRAMEHADLVVMGVGISSMNSFSNLGNGGSNLIRNRQSDSEEDTDDDLFADTRGFPSDWVVNHSLND